MIELADLKLFKNLVKINVDIYKIWFFSFLPEILNLNSLQISIEIGMGRHWSLVATDWLRGVHRLFVLCKMATAGQRARVVAKWKKENGDGTGGRQLDTVNFNDQFVSLFKVGYGYVGSHLVAKPRTFFLFFLIIGEGLFSSQLVALFRQFF